LVDLIAGWEELSNNFGSQGCTIAQALERLREDSEGRRHVRLRSAFAELCPHPTEQLPTARKIGYALRRFRGRVVAGRKLQTRTLEGNNLWFVQQIGIQDNQPSPLPA
jgi:hypothetical protein